jgi:hypothetical protein
MLDLTGSDTCDKLYPRKASLLAALELFPDMTKDGLLRELDRKNSKELVREFFPHMREWMETCIAALQRVAYSRRKLG